MSTEQLETLSKQACYSTDFQQKDEATTQLLSVYQQADASQYVMVMATGSQNTLFALGLILKRLVSTIPHYREAMHEINAVLLSWYNSNGKLYRGTQEIPPYIADTFGYFVGLALRRISMDKNAFHFAIAWLDDLKAYPRYKIFIYKHYFDAVSIFDEATGFMAYRELVFRFQEEAIPVMVEALVPYFVSFQENIQINELSQMHNKLSISEPLPNLTTNLFKLHFQEEEQRFNVLLFQLLEEIVSFKYNLTYTEFLNNVDYEDCIISFPKELINHFIKSEFIDALYFIIRKLMEDQVNTDFLLTCFACLEKIVKTKIIHTEDYKRRKFVVSHLQGCSCVLSIINIKAAIQDRVITKVVECCNILLGTFDLFEFQEAVEELGMGNLYLQFLSSMSQLAKSIINNQRYPLTIKSDITIKTTQAMRHAVFSIVILKDKYPKMKQIYKSIASSYMRDFLTRYCQQNSSLMGQTAIFNIEHLKNSSHQYFLNVKALCSVDIADCLMVLKDAVGYFLEGKNGSQVQVGNIVLLVSELANVRFFEDTLIGNNVYETNPNNQVHTMGGILTSIFDFITFYQTQSHSPLRDTTFLDGALLIFLERLIYQCLISFQNPQQTLHCFEFKFKLFHAMSPSIKNKNFLLSSLKMMMQFIFGGSECTVDFALEKIKEMVLKAKFSLDREIFRNHSIFKELMLQFGQLNRDTVESSNLRWRIKLYKIIAMLSFNDTSDQYRENINSMITFLKESLASGRYLQVMYDLTGAFETIQVETVFSFFIKSLRKQIQLEKLFEFLFKTYGASFQKLEDILRLSKAMVLNKGVKNRKCISIIVEYIFELAPYWCQVLQNYISTSSEQFLGCLSQIYQIFSVLLVENNINFGTLCHTKADIFPYFLKEVVSSMAQMCKKFEEYPNLFDRILDINFTFCGECGDVIFGVALEIGLAYGQLISNVMAICNSYFDDFAKNNTPLPNHFYKITDILSFFFTHLRKAQKMHHRRLSSKILEQIMGQKQEYLKFLFNIFRFCLGNGKNYLTSNGNLINMICRLVYLFKEHFRELVGILDLGQSMAKEIKRIVNKVEKEVEYLELLESQLKAWFSCADLSLQYFDHDY